MPQTLVETPVTWQDVIEVPAPGEQVAIEASDAKPHSLYWALQALAKRTRWLRQLVGDSFQEHRTAVPIDHPDLSVTTPKLADLCVTTPKLADLSVTTPKLADESVTEPKLHESARRAARGLVVHAVLPVDAVVWDITGLDIAPPSALQFFVWGQLSGSTTASTYYIEIYVNGVSGRVARFAFSKASTFPHYLGVGWISHSPPNNPPLITVNDASTVYPLTVSLPATSIASFHVASGTMGLELAAGSRVVIFNWLS